MIRENKDSCIKQKEPEKVIRSPITDNDNELAQMFRPLLVLFPEIENNSRRKDFHHSGHALGGVPPLSRDYHPRDINLILDNAHLPVTGIYRFLQHLKLPPRKLPPDKNRHKLLDAMGENKVDYIDLLGRGGPKHVDKYWSAYSGIENKADKYNRKAYARVLRGSGKFGSFISIQYWLAYFFDDWANVHEMDWEMVAVILKKEDTYLTPVACIYNAHNGSFRKTWKAVDKVIEKSDNSYEVNPEGSHPVVYVANGSHASYFSDYPSSFNVLEKYVKTKLQTMIRMANIATSFGTEFTDYVPAFDDENTVKIFPDIETIPEPNDDGKWSDKWRWLNFTGKWGSPAELSLKERLISEIPILRMIIKIFKRPLQEAGPSGPNAKSGSCWNKPFDWVNTECLDAEQSRNWLQEISCSSSCEK